MRAVDWIDRNGESMSQNIYGYQKVKVLKRVEERICDQCGNTIDPADFDSHELAIYLNPSRFRRDYCDQCLKSVWQKICDLISADPNDRSGSSFDE